MENATKALMIAAGILIGIMILSLAVALFSSMGEYFDITQKKIDENSVQKFNEQFTRYIGTTLTIQDIVTAANTAFENNQKYGLTDPAENNYYVTINMPEQPNLEKKINADMNTDVAEILKNNIDKKYTCILENVKINPNTGRVCKVTFSDV